MNKVLKTKKDFSTGGIVWDENTKKYLLIYVENLSGTKVWTFPKGHPEPKETMEQSAIREVMEETGWRCEILKPITDVHYFYVHEDIRYNKTVHWFLMKPIEQGGEFDPDEVLGIRWADAEETARLVTYGSDKELLKQTALLL